MHTTACAPRCCLALLLGLCRCGGDRTRPCLSPCQWELGVTSAPHSTTQETRRHGPAPDTSRGLVRLGPAQRLQGPGACIWPLCCVPHHCPSTFCAQGLRKPRHGAPTEGHPDTGQRQLSSVQSRGGLASEEETPGLREIRSACCAGSHTPGHELLLLRRGCQGLQGSQPVAPRSYHLPRSSQQGLLIGPFYRVHH